jgi:hypothetical protein
VEVDLSLNLMTTICGGIAIEFLKKNERVVVFSME